MHIIKRFRKVGQWSTLGSRLFVAMLMSGVSPILWAQSDDAMHLHGSEIYTATTLENKWLLDKHGQGELQTELESWIGTDENKLFIKGDFSKAESERQAYDVKALYSRNIATFWDAQAGLRYRYDGHKVRDQDAFDAVVGFHGLAPYFFETDAYAYVGQNQYVGLSLEAKRDILLTQKLIAEPFIKAQIVLHDNAEIAQKSGLSHAEVGVQTRYEINKQFMPFVEIGYAYDQGLKASSQPTQYESEAEHGLRYGVGLLLKF
ncbi:MAG: copper resistance protein B [Acinetobacter sp.]